RPIVKSRSLEEIAAEVSQLVAGGCPEIVLTGVHLGHYGIDQSKGRPKAEWRRLWHLLEMLDEMPGDFRIRLSSLEAAEARDDLVRAMANSRRVVPHLHLCLQSGSDRILRLMKRRYSATGFMERCSRLKKALDTPAFTTDVIVGFPGETDADFEATCKVVRDVGFAKVHVFPYSSRAGTPAALLQDAVPHAKIRERCEQLRQLERETATAYQRRLLGRRLDVLVEGADSKRAGWVQGTSCRYVPVVFRGHLPALLRRIIPVRAVGVDAGMIVGAPEAIEGVVADRVALPLA
ncbi:MAG: MiaB/RimO family radical SAM methylthiotransferase, partial [Planctomycetes bacterium]|nr:MiaB/RimO family radical SAM methylthiotransferase [Planctomycetota bacterium]